MYFLRRYDAAAIIDGVTLIARGTQDFRVNPTLASGDVKISKDGGAFTDLASLPTVTPSGETSVRIQLSATELTCRRAVIRFVDKTFTKEWEDQVVIVETYAGLFSGSPPAPLAQFGVDLEDVAGAAQATNLANDTPFAVWDYNVRTLTQAVIGGVDATLVGTTLTLRRGDSLALQITGLGSIVGRTALWFTLKDSTQPADAAAQIQIKEGNGLQVLAGQPAADATQGAINVTSQSAGDLTIVLDASESAKLPPLSCAVWDIQIADASGNIVTLVGGQAVITADVTRAT